ncbi:hypothetical protein D0T25_24340 [Duganella sp. BJB488]|uniref:hypothetical protein n=1 Tax=unclassified Duganella TaxID=2636909 RepID=UPI000E341438|nr:MULTISPECIES: hypothetical protein [unclassified Duganella]RFP09325.1 hypothetical protein D0T23_26845 [Duganella sp. BJB475]RFP13213.1 hypothetical protein D0T26_23280 [Duganella sp. BJB489]RFP17212.1 hypothetical protein D0T25_24340 [Duganella sp. BJB488]RFP25361.1 hypothetical protein D0T21_27875 [Duganella sp. BJB476]RFP31568.1 hypothetical protein D0T24_24375 [Duganella sp. BJB480]
MLKKLRDTAAASIADAAAALDDLPGSPGSPRRPPSSPKRSIPALLANLIPRRRYHVDVEPTTLHGEEGRGVTPGHIQIVTTARERTEHGLAPAYGHGATGKAGADAAPRRVRGALQHPPGTPYDFGTQVYPKQARPFDADPPRMAARLARSSSSRHLPMTRLNGPHLSPQQASALRAFEHAPVYTLNSEQNCVGGFAAAANAVLAPQTPLAAPDGDVTPQRMAAQALRKMPELSLDRELGLGAAIDAAERDMGVALTREQQAQVIENLVHREQAGQLDAEIKAVLEPPP